MQYDPVKKSLGQVFNKTAFLRILFYKMLNLLLLRSWYVRREIKKWYKSAYSKRNALDAGSGFGQYVWQLSKLDKTIKVKGLDIKPEQIDDCNTFFGKLGLAERIEFQEQDLTTFSETERYDIALAIDVMEHIEEDVKVMTNICNSLNNNGILIISTPSDLGGSDTHDDGDEHGFIDEHVRNGYNIDEIKQKLQVAGFSTIEAKYSYGKAGDIAWRLSMKIPIKMLNITKLFFIILPCYYLVTFPFALILNYIDVCTTHKTGTGLIVVAKKGDL